MEPALSCAKSTVIHGWFLGITGRATSLLFSTTSHPTSGSRYGAFARASILISDKKRKELGGTLEFCNDFHYLGKAFFCKSQKSLPSRPFTLFSSSIDQQNPDNSDWKICVQKERGE
jgi:hypothetical protein